MGKRVKLLDYPRRPGAEVCYLVCFRDRSTGAPRRYRHAGHYLGRTSAGRVDDRLDEHLAGRGSVLIAAAVAAGLTVELVRVWPGGSAKERQLKSCSGASYCPACSGRPLPGAAAPRPGAAYLTRRQREARAAGLPVLAFNRLNPGAQFGHRVARGAYSYLCCGYCLSVATGVLSLRTGVFRLSPVIAPAVPAGAWPVRGSGVRGGGAPSD